LLHPRLHPAARLCIAASAKRLWRLTGKREVARAGATGYRWPRRHAVARTAPLSATRVRPAD